jgi:hypothetical protein
MHECVPSFGFTPFPVSPPYFLTVFSDCFPNKSNAIKSLPQEFALQEPKVSQQVVLQVAIPSRDGILVLWLEVGRTVRSCLPQHYMDKNSAVVGRWDEKQSCNPLALERLEGKVNV